MKICFVADGKSSHVEVIANYFALKNHEVHLISPIFKEGYNSGIITHQLRCFMSRLGKVSYYLSFWYWIFQTRKFVSKINPDIVNGHYVTVYGFLASMTNFHPLVVTAWGSDVMIRPRNLFWRNIVKLILKKTDLFICLFNAKMLNSKLIPNDLPLASLPRGIDTNIFYKNNQNTGLRSLYGIEKTDPVVINIRGGSNIFYDPLTFLRAIPIVVKEFPNAKFLVSYQNKDKKTYGKMIKKLKVANNVIILDWMPRKEVAKHLAIADIYVSTTLSDGASNALFEGMACQLAPVVTDIPANRYWIKNEDNGLLFSPRDYQALAEKIIYLMKDKDKRETFGKKCRQIVLEQGDFNIQMAKTESIYQELVGKYACESTHRMVTGI